MPLGNWLGFQLVVVVISPPALFVQVTMTCAYAAAVRKVLHKTTRNFRIVGLVFISSWVLVAGHAGNKVVVFVDCMVLARVVLDSVERLSGLV